MRAVARVVRILRSFSAQRPSRSLSDIAETAGLDLGTARRILASLCDEGLAVRDARSKLYRLDLGLLELAGSVTEGGDLRARAQAAVDRVAAETGNTAFFGVRRGREALCLARSEGSAVVLVRWWTLGGRMPMHCGATPKAILAHLPAKDVDAILGGTLEPFTPRSETDPAAIRRELARIRRRGFALASDDVVLGVSGIAVPVFGRSGTLLGALAVACLTAQLGPAARAAAIGTLGREASSIGAEA